MKKAAITTGAFSLGSTDSSSAIDSQGTYIAAEVLITGDLQASGDVVVAGLIEGQIVSEAKVTIVEGGVVKGAIRATEILVAGSVSGDMTTSGSLGLLPTAVVRGDISMQRLIIEPGASFVGRCSMPEPSEQEMAANG
jgi:cytoskeletal protein CcmA (bactofilin family)